MYYVSISISRFNSASNLKKDVNVVSNCFSASPDVAFCLIMVIKFVDYRCYI
jgi:ABC-type siderophore export system fused ATPase/permease subunit